MRQVKRIVVAALAGLVVSAAAAQDAVQWRVEDGGNGHWYQLEPTKRGLYEARDFAVNSGGDLVSISGRSENDFLVDLTPEDPKDGVEDFVAWIGLVRDCGVGCDWYWTDEPTQPPTWTNWAPGEPNFSFENGGQIYRSPHPLEGQWNNVPVTDLWPSFIEWSADCNGDGIVDYGQILEGTFDDLNGNGVPDCCDDGSCIPPVQWRVEDGGNGHWYAAVRSDGLITFHAARFLAVEAGGDLAVLKGPDANDWVFGMLASNREIWWEPTNPRHGPWIGLRQDLSSPDYEEPSGGWQWVDGTPVTFTNWASATTTCENMPRIVSCDGIRTQDFGAFFCPEEGPSSCPDPTDAWASLQANHPRMESYLVEWSADCNGDGIVDYGQILDGTFADADGNGVPDLCEICIGDLNGDGVVGPPDLGILLAVWGTDGGDIVGADINGDGTVNASDLGPLLGAWGVCP